MSEKRFRLGYVCGDYGLIDNDEWIDLHSMSENSEKNVQICINKMNELSEENEQLKSICQDHRDHANDFKADCVRLEKENEQLKSRNGNLLETLAFRSNQLVLLEELIDDLCSEEMVKQMGEILNG